MKTSNKIVLIGIGIITIFLFIIAFQLKSAVIRSESNYKSHIVIKSLESLHGFHSINATTATTIKITNGMENITVESDSIWLAEAKFEISDSVLFIKDPEQYYGRTALIKISMPSIQNIELTGSGNIYIGDSISSNYLNLSLVGSGDIVSHCNALMLDVNLLGSGNIECKGKSKHGELKLKGSGDLHAGDCEIEEINLELLGSGNIFCNAKNKLNVTITGSGDVDYSGNPEVNQKILGSGSLNHR